MPHDPDLLPGMYAKARIESDSEKVPALPADAIVRSEGKDFIIIQKNKVASGITFKLIPVKKGTEQEGYTAVTLPDSIQKREIKIVMKGTYSILSALKNAMEEE